jgi:CHAT domain
MAAQIRWDDDLLLLDGREPAAVLLPLLERCTHRWVVLFRHESLLYPFKPDEILDAPQLAAARQAGVDFTRVALVDLLQLHEPDSGTQTRGRAEVPLQQMSLQSGQAPSSRRWVDVDAQRKPLAVGTRVAAGTVHRLRGARPSPQARPAPVVVPQPAQARPPLPQSMPQPAPGAAAPLPAGADPFIPDPAAEPTAAAAPEPASESAAESDEGSTPVRHPSIDCDRPLTAGVRAIFRVDLARVAVAHTQGGPVSIGALSADWTELPLTVQLMSVDVAFENGGRGTVTVRRNADSIAAEIAGTVRPDLPAGHTVVVLAQFLDGARFCGLGQRSFGPVPADASRETSPVTRGEVAIDHAAAKPDLTVLIDRIDPARPGRLYWHLSIAGPYFAGLPPDLTGAIDLGQDPAREAEALFKEFAVLKRGEHTDRIDGFGSELWNRAPQVMRDVYWALCDRLKRPLTIQFVTDEPHLPWELMRPVRADGSEIHEPLALRHAVARWLKRYQATMPNHLPAGRIYQVTPKYESELLVLGQTDDESKSLASQFGAVPVTATRAGVKTLLQKPPAEGDAVAVLLFSGHGKFTAEVASGSRILLEDGPLTASEVKRPEVVLGQKSRALVVLNACEVGAGGTVLGEVGGWAEAFIERRFGGFIAPLWSVDDDDASIVAAELFDGLLRQHLPVGEVLRQLREKHGAVSPTFYSYLYYGDVTATIG